MTQDRELTVIDDEAQRILTELNKTWFTVDWYLGRNDDIIVEYRFIIHHYYQSGYISPNEYEAKAETASDAIKDAYRKLKEAKDG